MSHINKLLYILFIILILPNISYGFSLSDTVYGLISIFVIIFLAALVVSICMVIMDILSCIFSTKSSNHNSEEIKKIDREIEKLQKEYNQLLELKKRHENMQDNYEK